MSLSLPDAKTHRNISASYFATISNQMLKLIAKFVGKPKDESELAFVTNPKAQKFMEDLPEYPPADLRRRFPSAGADAVDLLARMLVMRPDRRLSVDEALRHPYLRSLRDKKVCSCCGCCWCLLRLFIVQLGCQYTLSLTVVMRRCCCCCCCLSVAIFRGNVCSVGNPLAKLGEMRLCFPLLAAGWFER